MWQIPHAQASSSLFERVHARKLKYGDTNAHKTCRMNFVHKKELLFTGFHVTNGTKGSVSKVHRRWGISVCSRSMFLSMKKQRIVSKKCLFVTLRFSPLKIFSLFEPIYIPQTLNTGTCIQQSNLFYSAGLNRNHVLATANTGEIGRGFGNNPGEW